MSANSASRKALRAAPKRGAVLRVEKLEVGIGPPFASCPQGEEAYVGWMIKTIFSLPEDPFLIRSRVVVPELRAGWGPTKQQTCRKKNAPRSNRLGRRRQIRHQSRDGPFT